MVSSENPGADPPASAPARPWASYGLGLFGLSVSAQLALLVALRLRELGADFQTIGLIAALTSVTPAFFSIPVGTVIDRWGPKSVFVAGATIAGISSASLVLLTRPGGFYVLGPLAATAIAGAWTAAQIQVTGLASGPRRAIHTGRLSLFTNLGDMAGPLLAGVGAQLLGPRNALLVPAVYALAFAALAVVRITPSVQSSSEVAGRGVGLRQARGLLTSARMQIALLLTSARLWTHLVFLTFLPVHLADRGISAGVIGTVLATSGLTAAITAPMAGRLAGVWSERRVATASLALGSLALVLVPLTDQLPAVYVVPLLHGIGSGLSLPLLLSLTIAAAPAGQGGVALGLRATVNQIAGAAAPALVGPVLSSAGAVAGFSTGGLGGVAFLLLAAIRRRGQHAGRDGDRPAPRGWSRSAIRPSAPPASATCRSPRRRRP